VVGDRVAGPEGWIAELRVVEAGREIGVLCVRRREGRPGMIASHNYSYIHAKIVSHSAIV
jgi:hypothetical protein